MKCVVSQNPFVNNEAEDDKEEDEDHMHLELDEEETNSDKGSTACLFCG